MHIDARGYGYETFRDGGRVCRRYVGRGEWVSAAVYLDRLDRQRDAEKRQNEREQIEAAKTAQTALDAYCGALDSLVSDAMTAAGYHRHKRGNWRKRRSGASTQTIMSKQSKTLAQHPDRAQLLKAEKSREAARAVFDTVKGTPEELEMLDIYAPTASAATEHLVNVLSGQNELVKEAWRRRLETTARQVAGPNPTPLEIQLAHRVAACELSVTAFERLHTGCLAPDKSMKILAMAGRELDAAHRRHLSAIKTLATVRKAQLPDVQINIGEKQVNIGTLETR